MVGVMLRLDYAPEVPPALREVVEHHARAMGLPLATIESIGQSLDLVERFIIECEDGRGDAFAEFVADRAAGAAALGARLRTASA